MFSGANESLKDKTRRLQHLDGLLVTLHIFMATSGAAKTYLMPEMYKFLGFSYIAQKLCVTLII